jgi:hypothetical protein
MSCFKDSACASVRGNPSRRNPPPYQRQPLRSSAISHTIRSGTRSHRRMYGSAAFIAGLWSHSERLPPARNTSPVEGWQASTAGAAGPPGCLCQLPARPAGSTSTALACAPAKDCSEPKAPRSRRRGRVFRVRSSQRNLGAGSPHCRDPGHTSAGSPGARARSFWPQITGSTRPTRKIHEAAPRKATAATIRNAQ